MLKWDVIIGLQHKHMLNLLNVNVVIMGKEIEKVWHDCKRA